MIAVANSDYHFTSWSDDGTDNPRTDLGVTSTLSVTANLEAGIAFSNTGDLGLTDAQEAALGTDPNNPDSGFGMDGSPIPMSGKIEITWPSATGVLYRVWKSPNLTDWTVARDWASALTPPADSFELDLSPSNGYFKVETDIQ